MLKLYDYEFEAHPIYILPSVCTVNCGCATVLGILELEPLIAMIWPEPARKWSDSTRFIFQKITFP